MSKRLGGCSGAPAAKRARLNSGATRTRREREAAARKLDALLPATSEAERAIIRCIQPMPWHHVVCLAVMQLAQTSRALAAAATLWWMSLGEPGIRCIGERFRTPKEVVRFERMATCLSWKLLRSFMKVAARSRCLACFRERRRDLSAKPTSLGSMCLRCVRRSKETTRHALLKYAIPNTAFPHIDHVVSERYVYYRSEDKEAMRDAIRVAVELPEVARLRKRFFQLRDHIAMLAAYPEFSIALEARIRARKRQAVLYKRINRAASQVQ